MYFFRFTGITIGTEDLSKQNSNNPFEDPLEKDNPFFEGQEENTETETATASTIEEINLTPFHGIISKCFEQYLHIYIESQDQNLVELIDRAAQEQKIKGCTNLAVEGSSVLHSCGDLFMFYKKCMVQCALLSTGKIKIKIIIKIFMIYEFMLILVMMTDSTFHNQINWKSRSIRNTCIKREKLE